MGKVHFKEGSGSGRPSGSSSGGGSNKARKRNSSDSPSASATNQHGCDVVDARLRSVLSHPLGLSLLYALNGLDPSKLKCLSQKQQIIDGGDLGNLLSTSVKTWRTLPGQKMEDKLTNLIAKNASRLSQKLGYYAHSEVRLNDNEENKTNHPRSDILLSPSKSKVQNVDSETTTPYAVIEFGLNGLNWSKKLDQNIMYMDRMVEGKLKNKALGFSHPVLCGVVTIEDKEDFFDFRIGVFLCARRDFDDPDDKFRMSLLWHARADTLEKASNCFGRLLQVTHDFKSWINDIYGFAKRNRYQYLSSTCCRCTIHYQNDSDEGQHGNTDSVPRHQRQEQSPEEKPLVVLRSYDNRARKSLRNPEIYLDETCQVSVGVGQTHRIASLFDGNHKEDIEALEAKVDKHNPLESALWEQMGKRNLTIISTPYREGRHYATSPKAFVPVIRQLQQLHEAGYVHGDIRAYNTVFGKDSKEGWLIDFDYGGRIEKARYPPGYKGPLLMVTGWEERGTR